MSAWRGTCGTRGAWGTCGTAAWSTWCAVLAFVAVNNAHVAAAAGHSVRWERTFQQSDGQQPVVSQTFEDDKQGYLGCLISDSLCNSEEICFDDNIFGRCLSPEEEDAASQQKIWPLSTGDLSLIAFESERLRANGFHLADIYSQCVLENVVAAIELNAAFSDSACSLFLPASDEGDVAEEVDDGADELEPEQIITDIEERSIVPKKMAEQSRVSPLFSEPELVRVREDEDGSIVIEPNQEELFNSYLSAAADDEDNHGDFNNVDDQQNDDDNEDLLRLVLPELLVSPNDDFSEDVTNDVRKLRKRSDVIRNNNNNDNDDDDDVDNNIMQDSEDGPEGEMLMPLDVAWSVDNNNSEDDEDDDSNGDLLVYVPRDSASDSNGEDNEDSEGEVEEVVVADSGLESNVFNRHERLDVKKPGPFFKNSANNFFLDKLLNSDYDQSAQDDHYDYSDGMRKNESEGQAEYELPLLAKEKRDLPLGRESPESQQQTLVHINTKNRLSTWRQGSDLIDFLAHEFGLPEHALVDRKIDPHHVQFGVASNPQSVTAEEMAKALGADISLRKRIDQHVGLRVDQAAAAPSMSDISSVFPTGSNLNQLLAVVVFASATAILLVLGVILLLVLAKRRRSAATDKLRRQDIDAEEKDKAKEEYKQLCRDWSRSSKKSESGKHNSAAAVVPTSVKKQLQNKESRESEGSNRSSTSSWCEEPNSTNMDISTGHMVLAYMEDHLKNKQRLEQEWVSLCGYEAEPCATTIAFKAENKKKNRYPDKLPYDHNRVILNAMVNANNSDYINASTVTDHDPRNPSYIVCQGPMATTVADFWQMIWEQGCVVIVQLTKLQDNNAHAMCHRYWPQEGSEQYHIFEVHLVSEHIWCDDYLVRSVYLKNTRTGETRTVTQFHFMSWPEHGVPTSTKALLEFRRKVNKSYRGRSAPICVHCSDGVGRSGTYVLIDMVLNRMAKGCKEIDIAATLEHVRDQRGGMVATRHQFEFCLTAVAEEVHAILKAMPQ